MPASDSRPHSEDPGYLTERKLGKGEFLTLYHGSKARAAGCLCETWAPWILMHHPSEQVAQFRNRREAEAALALVSKGQAKFEDYLAGEDHSSPEPSSFNEQDVAAEMLQAFWRAASPEDIAASLADMLEATKYVPVGDGEYRKVPDWAARDKGLRFWVESLIGKPRIRQEVIVKHDKEDSLSMQEQIRRSEPYRDAFMAQLRDWGFAVTWNPEGVE